MVVEQKQIHQKCPLEVGSLKEINNILLARSKWKNKTFSRSVWSLMLNLKSGVIKKSKQQTLFSRSSTIPKCFTGLKIFIHKGKIFKKFIVYNQVVGLKFGEFSFTKKPFFFPKKDQKKNKKR